jgi:hypothetical protein
MPKIARNKTDLIEIAIKKLHMRPEQAKLWAEEIIKNPDPVM